MTNIAVGALAPGFTLKGIDGKDYALGRLLEKGLVVAAFFKVSCPVCQFTFPFLDRLHKKYGGDEVTILGVSQDDASATRKFNASYGVTFPVVLDTKGYPVSNAYGLTSVPTTFLIDTNGIVKVASMGFEKSGLEQIAQELAERKKLPPASLFLPTESVPAYRPG